MTQNQLHPWTWTHTWAQTLVQTWTQTLRPHTQWLHHISPLGLTGSSATSCHGCASSKPKSMHPPTTETVYRSTVGNTSMKCSFDVAKWFGCHWCFFQFPNETCVSHDTDALQDRMVPAGPWSQVQDAKSEAVAAEEEACLTTVQEVKAAMSNAGIEDNSTSWDEIEEDDLWNVDFDDDIDDGNQEDVHSEYTSTGPHTSTPWNSVVILDDENLKLITWNSERDLSTPAPDPPSPTLPPPLLLHPALFCHSWPDLTSVFDSFIMTKWIK